MDSIITVVKSLNGNNWKQIFSGVAGRNRLWDIAKKLGSTLKYRKYQTVASLRDEIRSLWIDKTLKDQESAKQLFKELPFRKSDTSAFVKTKDEFKQDIQGYYKKYTLQVPTRIKIPEGKKWRVIHDVEVNLPRGTTLKDIQDNKNLIRRIRAEVKEMIEEIYDGVDFLYIDETFHTNGWGIFEVKERNITEERNREKSLQVKLLSEINKGLNLKQRDGYCAFDYIYEALRGQRGFRRNWTKERLAREFEDLSIDWKKGLSIKDIDLWVKKCTSSVGYYALGPHREVIQQYVPPRENGSRSLDRVLCFMINNNHLYPILEKETKKWITKTKELPLKPIQWQVKYSPQSWELVNIDKMRRKQYKQYKKLIRGEFKPEKSVILIESEYFDLGEIMADIINETNYHIEYVKINESKFRSFVHPVSEQIFELSTGFKERKQAAETLTKEISNAFYFNNQSWLQLGKKLCDYFVGRLEKSTYSNRVRKVFDTYQTQPLTDVLCDPSDFEYQDFKQIDVSRCYPTQLKKNPFKFCVFSIFNDFEELKEPLTPETVKLGFYLVDDFEIPQLGGIRFNKQLMPYFEVYFLLKKGYLPAEKVKFYIRPTHTYEPDLFKKMIKFGMKKLPKKCHKPLLNTFIGSLGKRYNKKEIGIQTTSDSMAMALKTYFDAQGYETSLLWMNNIWFVRYYKKKRIFEDHAPFNYHVLGLAHIRLLKMAERYYEPGKTKIVKYNTDSILFANPRDLPLLDSEKEEELDISRVQDFWNSRNPWEEKLRDPFVTDEILPQQWKWNNENNQSFLCNAPAGYGKSTLAKKEFDKLPKETITLCFTNAACDNLREKGFPNHCVKTLNTYFNIGVLIDEIRKENKNLGKNRKLIQVDEISMVPKKLMIRLYKLQFDNPHLKFQFYGDFNQCKPVESDGLWFDYREHDCVREMCGYNLRKLDYHKNARYDEELKKMLDYFLENYDIPREWKNKKIDPKLKTNICLKNKTRDEINDKFAPDGIKPDMEIICERNYYKEKVYNGQFFTCQDVIGDKTIIPKGKFLKKHFRPAYCVTVYKYQGKTITEDFNIYDAHKMSFNEFYTAISRAKSASQIHFDGEKISNEVIFRKNKPWKKISELEPRKSEQGSIYLMWNDKLKIYYIGSTMRSTDERVQEHFTTADPNIRDVVKDSDPNKENWKWRTIEEIFCYSESELRDFEENYFVPNFRPSFIKGDSDEIKNYKMINTRGKPKIPKIYRNKKIEKEVFHDQQTNSPTTPEVPAIGRYILAGGKRGMFKFYYYDTDGKRKQKVRKFTVGKTEETAREKITKDFNEISQRNPRT